MRKSDHGEGPENDDVAEDQCESKEPLTELAKGPNNKTNGNRLSDDEHDDEEDVVTDCKSPEKVPNNDSQTVDKELSSNEEGVSGSTVLQDEKIRKEGHPSETGRRSTRLQGKRPKLTQIITSSDEEFLESDDDDDDDYDNFSDETERTPSKRGRPPKKKRAVQHTASKIEGDPKPKASPKENKSKKITEPPGKPPKEFCTGSFVVLKTDFHATTTPPIWRIDGKALLQKYIHFDLNGQIAYKNTSTYSGWTLNTRDQYYPATVEFISQTRKDTIVKFKRELIVDDDSD